MEENSEWRLRLQGVAAIVVLFGLMRLYVREFPVFSNTIGIGRLAVGSVLLAAVLAAGIVRRFRERLLPAGKHWPELVFIVVPMLFFAPLFGSWLNRSVGEVENQTFEFVSEQAFVASGYGILKGEKIKPTGYRLNVRESQNFYTFQYRQQAYYPITVAGEKISLPVKKGLLGFRVIQLK